MHAKVSLKNEDRKIYLGNGEGKESKSVQSNYLITMILNSYSEIDQQISHIY
jgi:hypothetical protein